jgi:hypothetical protein
LLESFSMFPVDYVEATATLHLAFSEGIDYGVLHAIEQMLACRTEPCLALPSVLRPQLESLARERAENEIAFDGVEDAAESARIVRSYAVRVSASEIRLAACGDWLWIRLLRPQLPAIDLLLRNSTGYRAVGDSRGSGCLSKVDRSAADINSRAARENWPKFMHGT